MFTWKNLFQFFTIHKIWSWVYRQFKTCTDKGEKNIWTFIEDIHVDMIVANLNYLLIASIVLWISSICIMFYYLLHIWNSHHRLLQWTCWIFHNPIQITNHNILFFSCWLRGNSTPTLLKDKVEVGNSFVKKWIKKMWIKSSWI